MLLTWLGVMVAVWREVQIVGSVVVELTRIWLSWYVVEIFTSSIISARHAATDGFWCVRKFLGHSGTPCRRIHRTQSCSVRSACYQFKRLMICFISRHQPSNYRQNLQWHHFLAYVRSMFKLELVCDVDVCENEFCTQTTAISTVRRSCPWQQQTNNIICLLFWWLSHLMDDPSIRRPTPACHWLGIRYVTSCVWN